MTNPESPAKLIEQQMETSGVSRESAIRMLVLTTEATFRAAGPTQRDIQLALIPLLIREAKKREAWMIEYTEAGLRKNLPKWIKLNDEALERGQDPATVISMQDKRTMDSAREIVEDVAASKAGKTIEELAIMSFDRGDKLTDEVRGKRTLAMLDFQ